MSIFKKLSSWVPAVLFAFGIFYMSSRSNPPGAGLFEFIPNSDKLVHMTEYFILSSLIYFALRKAHNIKTNKAVLAAVLIASLYGMTDEYHQSFVPERSMDILDWAADIVGAIIGASSRYKVRIEK
ncbi:MAG: hypothetical protein A2452_09830 [Candidatus Firestonebacteria bacterium RIFOXYC2_FULL_39_67]|nr:MAG: hypothetical protein A2536_03940 [Candidatus Firestonebacteria bacterium RIFOXYD2_FULL_39_29]OGF54661.1 MAG: hypothetical protein A2452_09830 [Candidatus Firestonebacteria bacterium RIFOXYC2_FULL_39_67]